MKKTFAVAAALLTICASAFAAPPPAYASSHRIHVSPSHRMHAPVRNRVHMTPAHPGGHIGGRMSSVAPYRHVGPPPGRVYVRPSYRVHHYHRPVMPPRWRYSGYYSGHYWRPYGGSVVVAYPAGYYYPYYGWGYYGGPGVHVSVRL